MTYHYRAADREFVNAIREFLGLRKLEWSEDTERCSTGHGAPAHLRIALVGRTYLEMTEEGRIYPKPGSP